MSLRPVIDTKTSQAQPVIKDLIEEFANSKRCLALTRVFARFSIFSVFTLESRLLHTTSFWKAAQDPTYDWLPAIINKFKINNYEIEYMRPYYQLHKAMLDGIIRAVKPDCWGFILPRLEKEVAKYVSNRLSSPQSSKPISFQEYAEMWSATSAKTGEA